MNATAYKMKCLFIGGPAHGKFFAVDSDAQAWKVGAQVGPVFDSFYYEKQCCQTGRHREWFFRVQGMPEDAALKSYLESQSMSLGKA